MEPDPGPRPLVIDPLGDASPSLAGGDPPPAELRGQPARVQLAAAKFLCEGGVELLVREPAGAGADLTVDSEGARAYLAHDLRRDKVQIASDRGRVWVDRLLVRDDRR